MNERMRAHIASLQINGAVLDRIENAFIRATRLSPEGLTELFVSEYTTNEGQRVWDSVWFRSEKYILEADAFMTRDTLDIVHHSKNVKRIEVTSAHYDFAEASTKSRLSAQIEWHADLSGVLKATAGNCDHLFRVVREWFVSEVT